MKFQKRNQGLVFGATFAVCGAIAMALLFTNSTQVAQSSAGAVTPAELDAALQHALPGRTAAHAGTGPGSATGGGMGTGRAARSVNMADLPKMVPGAVSSEDQDHDRPTLCPLCHDEPGRVLPSVMCS